MTIDQEAEDVTASVRHLLIQRGVDVRKWERQAGQWEKVAQDQRKEIERLRTALDGLYGAVLHDMTARDLPHEWSADSAMARASAALEKAS